MLEDFVCGGGYEFATQFMDRTTVYGLYLECDNGGLLAHDHRCSICRKDACLVRWMDDLTMMMQVISCSLAWAIHGVKIVLPNYHLLWVDITVVVKT
jgi:hypothetical protein